MTEPLVALERHGAVARLTLNDPDRRNAMTRAMGEALAARVRELSGSESVRAVVLTGAGSAFSAGGDLAMIEQLARAGRARPGGEVREESRQTMREFYELFLAVGDLPVPVVAAIHGPAVGAGLAVALACDLRLAARDARMGLNFVRLGIHPGMGTTWLLPRLVGPAHAADLLYTGRLVQGDEAERMGLVNRALEAERVIPEALELAERIAAGAPLALRGTKQALRRSAQATLSDQLDFEAEQQALCYETEDLAEGLAAARERRDPQFRGR